MKSQILAFANHLGNPQKDPERKAIDRGWLDTHGRPTGDGKALISALHEQRETRSTFRSVA